MKDKIGVFGPPSFPSLIYDFSTVTKHNIIVNSRCSASACQFSVCHSCNGRIVGKVRLCFSVVRTRYWWAPVLRVQLPLHKHETMTVRKWNSKMTIILSLAAIVKTPPEVHVNIHFSHMYTYCASPSPFPWVLIECQKVNCDRVKFYSFAKPKRNYKSQSLIF